MAMQDTRERWAGLIETEQVIIQAIGEMGLVTEEELLNLLKEDPFNLTLTLEELRENLSRMEAKDLITRKFMGKRHKWALRDIPFPPKDTVEGVKGTKHPEAEKILRKRRELEEKEAKPLRQGKYRNPKKFKVTFKCVDPILGGDLGEEERKLCFPKKPDGTPTFRAGWFHGWLRDNRMLAELPLKIQNWVAWGEPEFPEGAKLTTVSARVLKGFAIYEALPADTTFTVNVVFPMVGTKIKTKEELFKALEIMGTMPIRGFGANARYYGGRIKPIKIEEA